MQPLYKIINIYSLELDHSACPAEADAESEQANLAALTNGIAHHQVLQDERNGGRYSVADRLEHVWDLVTR